MNIKYAIVEADTNDGDYVMEQTVITDEDINVVKNAIAKLNGIGSGLAWGKGDMREDNNDPHKIYPQLSDLEIDIINDISPHGEYGIHTIESIKILEVVSEESIL